MAEAPSVAPGTPEPVTAQDPPAVAAPAPPPVPAGTGEERIYGAVFGRVWVAAVNAARSMSHWNVIESDSVRGEVLVDVRGMFSSGSRQAWIRMSLDELGMTRVEADFFRAKGQSLGGLKRRQISRFFRQLEANLRSDR